MMGKLFRIRARIRSARQFEAISPRSSKPTAKAGVLDAYETDLVNDSLISASVSKNTPRKRLSGT